LAKSDLQIGTFSVGSNIPLASFGQYLAEVVLHILSFGIWIPLNTGVWTLWISILRKSFFWCQQFSKVQVSYLFQALSISLGNPKGIAIYAAFFQKTC